MSKRNYLIILLVSIAILGGGGYATKVLLDKPEEKVADTKPVLSEINDKLTPGSTASTDTPANGPVENTSLIGDVDLTQVAGKMIPYDEFVTDREKYRQVKVVYFFSAAWCPTCQGLNKSIQAEGSQIPKNTLIVYVDYDKYTDLKKTYGVTYQHTLVQIDAEDKQLKKYAGSPDLLSVLAELQ